MTCLVCAGRGFVKAAPVEIVATWTGSDPTPTHEPRAAWDQAIAVPCWACFHQNIGVIA